MGHCVAPFPLSFSSKIRFLCHPNCNFSSFRAIFRPHNHRIFSVPDSVGQEDLQLSWASTKQSATDDYNGWAVVEAPVVEAKKKKGGTILVIGSGVSVAVLLAVVVCFSVSKRGCRFQFSDLISALQGNLLTSRTEEGVSESEPDNAGMLEEKPDLSERGHVENATNAVDENTKPEPEDYSRKPSQPMRVILPVASDPTQEEALSKLKKLKILEDDVRADEFCTRREYARWLVQANSHLERSRKHRLVPSAALSASVNAAFQDVSVGDPDFEYIQTLAEAGILSSKLSGISFFWDQNKGHDQGAFYFFPDRFISRQDLISWKAKLEYEVLPGVNEEISRSTIGFLDVREISSEALVDLYTDTLADGRSIMRRVFGQSKRLQPKKPCTKAQAAVALTSGKMTETLTAELSRMKAENTARHIAMQEIRSELINRDDIKQFWNKKIEVERIRGLKAEEDYRAALDDLEHEKGVLESSSVEFLKQKASLDCQKQLLSSLKQEINEMAETISLEKANCTDDRSNLEAMLSDLQAKYDKLLDMKAILEAETEALRILRSWVEDEAMKSRARAKVLEEVEQRWKWYKES